MSKLDRLNREIAIFEKLLFAAMASLLAVIGWIVSNYTTANTVLVWPKYSNALNHKRLKEECLSKLILFGELSLRRALRDYLTHYHAERNHQGKGNVLLFPDLTRPINQLNASVNCRERLGGLLKYYHQEAA